MNEAKSQDIKYQHLAYGVRLPQKVELHLETDEAGPMVRFASDDKLKVFRWLDGEWIERDERSQVTGY